MKKFSVLLSKFLTAILIVVLGFSALPVPTARAADTGFLNPTGCTSAAGQWATPGNATADDGAFTTSNANNEVLICSFNLPVIPAGNTITNIEVEINGSSSGSREAAVDLSWNNGTYTTGDPNTSFTGAETTFTLSQNGGTNTPWGRTWTPPGEFTAANFRVRLTSNNGSNVISLDQIRVRVTYFPPVTITVTQGANGTITPAGPAVSVPYLNDQAFDITPATSFIVNDVVVDGGSQGRENSYTFNNVTANHTITASFDGGWFQPSSNVNNGWTTQANAYTSNNSSAVGGTGDIVDYCGFNLGIPANSTIDGIEVAIEGSSTGSREADVSLSWDGGTSQTSTETTNMSGTEATDILGSSSNDWGRFWSSSDLSNANFCVQLDTTGGSGNVNIDQVQVRVTYHPSVLYTIISNAGTGGTITPFGSVLVQDTTDQSYDSTPSTGFILQDVVVDGGSVGRANAYTFTNVLSDHTITSTFNGGWSQPSTNTNNGGVNPANAYVSDNNSAVLNSIFDNIVYCGFNLAIPPNSTVDGIEVAFEGNSTGAREVIVGLSGDAGGTYRPTTYTTSVPNGGTEATYILGGAGDDWGGGVWSASELSNANFCVGFLTTGLTGGNFNIDQVQVKVTYHPSILYTITATAGTGGTITPSGAVSVQDTADQSFDSTPNATYILSDVSVDGGSVGRANAYTFTNVLADHTIAASFNGGWTAPSANANNTGWTNPANVYVSDNVYANVTIIGSLDLAGFNFVPTIPAGATIEGIEIAIEATEIGSRELNVSLSWNNGSNFTSTQATSFVNDGPESTIVLGGPTNTWGRTWTGAEFANFRIRLAAPFALGQLNVDQIQVKVYYDDLPPDTTITVAPTNPSNDTTPTFEFTGTDDVGGSGVASFECQVDGGGFSACASPFTLSTLTDGSHTFEVRAIDFQGNVDPTPASYTWVVETSIPVVTRIDSIQVGDGDLLEYEVVTVQVTGFNIIFSEAVFDPANDTDPDDVTNPNNYLLVRDLGATTGFQTIDCASGAVEPADTRIVVDSVSYNSSTYTATLAVNGGLPLSNGTYRLFTCGTTSIVDLSGTPLNFNGNTGLDHARTFVISQSLSGGNNNRGSSSSSSSLGLGTLIPVTGFSPVAEFDTLGKPLNQNYNAFNLRIEIPSLSISTNIVGVNRYGNSWDVEWLGNNVGYLEGSSYPTWAGNTVLTGHVNDKSNRPGPFAYLNEMKAGEKIYLYSNGLTYVYQVEQTLVVSSTNVKEVFKHQEYDWITLVTCENYDEISETYLSRRVVRAVLISVIETK